MSLAAKVKKRFARWELDLAYAENEHIAKLGLLRLIFEDWRRNVMDWTTPGFRAMAVYRFGTWAKTFRFLPLRLFFLFFHVLMFRYVRNHYGIEIYATSKIGRRLLVGHQSGIVIHKFATIGDDCIIRQGVTFGEAGMDRDNFSEGIGPVVGNGVDFGAGVVVIGNVKIGDDVRVFPNAVVVNDVPSNSTVITAVGRAMPRKPPEPEA